MILRLIVLWLFISVSFFLALYIADRKTKTLASFWSRKFAYCGAAAGIILSLIVYLERF